MSFMHEICADFASTDYAFSSIGQQY